MQSEYDHIIIGSGIAGLYTALMAAQYGATLVLTKDSIDECNTRHAQGGIAAPVAPIDSPTLHFEDTMSAGAGLCDPGAVRVLTSEAVDRISDLVQFGVLFDTVDGEIALAREGAHSVARVLHSAGDATGASIETTLSGRIRRSAVAIADYHLVTGIAQRPGGGWVISALNIPENKRRELICQHLVLATGGAGQLYRYNTNSSVATADGVGLAYQAGAEITDMEFIQFHPTALRLPGAPTFLISEAVRGEGALLRTGTGRRFMPEYHPQAELAARDIVARAMLSEMQKTGSDHVLLDITHLPPAKVAARFPSIYRFCMEHGLDITHSPIPVAPAAHYTMGGVRTNLWGETNLPGLYACGEAACTGVHGANRLASNSLLETLIFGKRIVERIVGGPASGEPRIDAGWEPDIVVGEDLCVIRDCSVGSPGVSDLQELMWRNVGIIRERWRLEEARDCIRRWQAAAPEPYDRTSQELANLVLVARIVAEAALRREESRGAHHRADFPEESARWKRHIVFRREGL
ncbi:MAG: L-aspartate oxidase [Chloroflexota bacterium]|nr:MAG: L-aspartate oxidase [Chloroflexota bacterium]